MPEYSQGKIYKLVRNSKSFQSVSQVDADDRCLYVGSTIQTLDMRLYGHKQAYVYGVNMPLYRYIRSLGDENGWVNIEIQLVCEAPCNTLDELRKIEGEYIRLLKPHCNRVIAGRNSKQYYLDNKDRIKQFYQDNKTRIIDYKKQYKLAHADHIRDYMQHYYKLKRLEVSDAN